MPRLSQKMVVAGLLVVGIGITAVLVLNPPEVTPQPRAEYVPLVRVHPVALERISLPVYTRGTVSPVSPISLVAEVGGRVESIAPQMSDGSFFKKGDKLFQIERRPYELELTKAQAAVASARLHVAQAEAMTRSNRAMAGFELSPYAKGEPQLQDAQFALKAALAGLEEAQTRLGRTAVVAPFDGRVKRRLAQLGQSVAPGTPLAEGYGIAFAEVRLPLTAEQMALLPGLNRPDLAVEPIRVELIDPGTGHHWTGTVVRAEGEIDARDRLLYVAARVEDPYGLGDGAARTSPLMAGAFVEARIEGREYADVAALPRAAAEGGDSVWVVTADGRLEQRPIHVLLRGKDLIYVGEGLRTGDQVLLTKLDTRVEGMRVNVAPAAPPTASRPAG